MAPKAKTLDLWRHPVAEVRRVHPFCFNYSQSGSLGVLEYIPILTGREAEPKPGQNSSPTNNTHTHTQQSSVFDVHQIFAFINGVEIKSWAAPVWRER